MPNEPDRDRDNEEMASNREEGAVNSGDDEEEFDDLDEDADDEDADDEDLEA